MKFLKITPVLLCLFVVLGATAYLNESNIPTAIDTDDDTLKIGVPAPEIVIKSQRGREIKLSELRGKLVLIEFWASWCEPCRVENPYLVDLYRRYKDKKFTNGDGFEIFHVSLDENKFKWINAIKEDGLIWDYHGCDLKGANSPVAVDYQIDTIPSNYLIDQDGIIIEKNLKGRKLNYAIRKYTVK